MSGFNRDLHCHSYSTGWAVQPWDLTGRWQEQSGQGAMSCKERTRPVFSPAGTKLHPAMRWPRFQALGFSFPLAKLCSRLFIKYQTQNQKMPLLLLPLPLPIAEMQPKSTAGNQVRNTALLASDKESFLSAHLSKMDQTSGGDEAVSPGQLHCYPSPTSSAPRPGGRSLPILGAGMGWGEPAALQTPLGDCTVSPTTRTLPTLREDFGQKFSTNRQKG